MCLCVCHSVASGVRRCCRESPATSGGLYHMGAVRSGIIAFAIGARSKLAKPIDRRGPVWGGRWRSPRGHSTAPRGALRGSTWSPSPRGLTTQSATPRPSRLERSFLRRAPRSVGSARAPARSLRLGPSLGASRACYYYNKAGGAGSAASAASPERLAPPALQPSGWNRRAEEQV